MEALAESFAQRAQMPCVWVADLSGSLDLKGEHGAIIQLHHQADLLPIVRAPVATRGHPVLRLVDDEEVS